MKEAKHWAVLMAVVAAWGIWTAQSPVLAAEEQTSTNVAEAELEDEGDIENLMSIQGEVTAVDPKANTVSIKDPNAKDASAAAKNLTIDPKTTTIWGEYDEIKLGDLPVGSKVAGEYKQNPNGSMTATYLEIVLDEEAELPALDEAPEETQKPAEKSVE